MSARAAEAVANEAAGGEPPTLRGLRPLEASGVAGRQPRVVRPKRRPAREPERADEAEPAEEPVDLKAHGEQLAKELYKPVQKVFPTRMVSVPALDHVWGADLADMDADEEHKYILTVIDIYSRYAWAKPLKTKTAKETTAAFKAIIKESKRKPKYLWVDQGKEFYNKELDKFRAENGIDMYSTFGNGKSAVVERFNKTIKSLLYRRMTARNTLKWLGILPDMIAMYNASPHTKLRITLSPDEASRPELARLVDMAWRARQDEHDRKTQQQQKFQVGDRVRVSRAKGVFEKGYDQNWSHEIFEVAEVIDSVPVTYRIKDKNGEVLRGTWYNQELQRTQMDDHVLVERVISEDKQRGLSLVKWVGLSEKQATWVPTNTLSDVRGFSPPTP